MEPDTSPSAGPSASPVRLMQWNVFEDGLADTPANLSFPPAFSRQFTQLLQVLSNDDGGGSGSFYGFKATRDPSRLPEAACISSTQSFFGFVDVLYCLVYHALGGEAMLSDVELPVERTARSRLLEQSHSVPLGSALRTLFLHSTLDDPHGPPGDNNRWSVPRFEPELAKAAAGAAGAADAVRAVKSAAFDAATGTLLWGAGVARRIVKRETLALNKWMGIDEFGAEVARGLRNYIAPGAALGAASAAALSRFCRLGPTCGPVAALVQVTLDESGRLQALRTPTLQCAVRWLIAELCCHARANPAARQAVTAFCGCDVPAEHDAWPAPVFARVLSEMQAWTAASALPQRHAQYCRVVAAVDPDVVTLAEFDAQWQALPAPTGRGRRYETVVGRGTGGIMFDAAAFEREGALGGVALPAKVRSAKERGDGECRIAPKNSCVALLRRRGDGALFLVVAVHLESGPSSDTKKVALRAAAARAIAGECEGVLAALREARRRCILVVGGDFNGPREEFVHGNSDAFFRCRGVAAVEPPLKRPAATAPIAGPPEPPVASLGAAGQLRLRCQNCDSGWLTEAAPMGGGGTRAGSNMIIDFLLLGTLGRTIRSTTPLPVVLEAEAASAADPIDGVRHAVLSFGSDHLPVACVVEVVS